MAVRTLTDTGSPENRIDIVILGDGYTLSEITVTFTNHAKNFIDYIFSESNITEPFANYKNFFNVHLIDVISNQSGADDPVNGIRVDTALNASYSFDGSTDRLLYIDDGLANSIMANELSGTGISADMKVLTVNSEKYGGGGGLYGVYAGGNADALEVALHEIGHSFASLADEYGGNVGAYTGVEPAEINVTKDPTGAKWSHWNGYDQPGVGVIGAYEGGRYFDQGIYRPSNFSKMNVLNNPFDVVSREAFILQFYAIVDPLDDYAFKDVAGIIENPGSLWVDTIDDNVIEVEWFVDGTPVLKGPTNLTMQQLGLTSGKYEIMAKAVDPTDWVRQADRSGLEQKVVWNVSVESTGSTVTGTAGDKVLLGTAGNDSLDGGLGQDTAIYSGFRSDYVVLTASTGKTLVVDSVAGRDGKDSLQNVENIRFGTEALTLAAALVEPADADNSAFQVYRFYNTETGSHFFTTSIAERNSVIETLDVLSFEGNAFDSNVTEANGTAVFRFYNKDNGVHFYTAAAEEAASLRLNAGFLDEGISYYAANDDSNGGTALYRFYNTQNDSHFYTVSEAERDNIINTIGHYKYEDVAFYVDAA
jgi:hypothetical protein